MHFIEYKYDEKNVRIIVSTLRFNSADEKRKRRTISYNAEITERCG